MGEDRITDAAQAWAEERESGTHTSAMRALDAFQRVVHEEMTARVAAAVAAALREAEAAIRDEVAYSREQGMGEAFVHGMRVRDAIRVVRQQRVAATPAPAPVFHYSNTGMPATPPREPDEAGVCRVLMSRWDGAEWNEEPCNLPVPCPEHSPRNGWTPVRHPDGRLAMEPAPDWPTVADTERCFASIDKAWPYLAKHADHIDGEFNLACTELRRAVAALFAQRDARARAAAAVPEVVREAVNERMGYYDRKALYHEGRGEHDEAKACREKTFEARAWLAATAPQAGEG